MIWNGKVGPSGYKNNHTEYSVKIKSLQILNKLRGKEILKRKTKVTQLSYKLVSICPQHKTMDEKDGQVATGDTRSGPLNG